MPDCPVPLVQDLVELDWLLAKYRELNPMRILEIGSAYGGTLWTWITNARPGAVVVSVDLIPDNHLYSREMVSKSRQSWRGWAEKAGVRLRTRVGNSNSLETVSWVEKYQPFDFVFIDGGHDYQTVSGDCRLYWPMLRKGGLMALHDIAYDLQNPHCLDVGLFWGEIKAAGLRTAEIINRPGICGIGVIEKENG